MPQRSTKGTKSAETILWFLCFFVAEGFWARRMCSLLWHRVCSRDSRHDTEQTEAVTESPPPTSPERRLPLRQLPSERSFSASPRNVDPVSDDWVLPLLKAKLFQITTFCLSDEICHFGSDAFCLFASKVGDLTCFSHA